MADTITKMLSSWSSPVVLIALGGLLAPSLTGGGFTPHPTDDPHRWYLLLAFLSTSTLLLTTNVFGPLRYANTSYPAPFRAFRATLPEWAPTAAAVALVALPWSRIWILAGLPLAWLYTREYHREAAAALCASAETSYTRAASAAQRAEKEQRAVRSLEERGFEIAVAAGRDSRIARRIQVSDFCGHAITAWSMVRDVSVAAEDAAQQAALTDEAVRNASGAGSGYNLANLQRHVGIANARATDLQRRSKETENRVGEFHAAKDAADEYRKWEDRTAAKSLEVAKNISGASKEALRASRSASRLAVEALKYVAAAKTASSKGDLNDAQLRAKSAGEAANQAEQQLKNAEKARDDAQRYIETLVATQSS